MKILLLTNILPPYRVPLYNLLGEKFEKEGHKFKIAFLAENEGNRAWQVRASELKVEAIVLSGWHKFFWGFEFPLHLNWGVWGFLRQEKPDMVISGGYSALANWCALAYCKHFRKPIILWTSTTKESVRGRDPLRRSLRAFFIRQADAFITYGKKATEYLLDFGVEPQTVFTGCNIGDVEFFRKASAAYRESAEFKNRLESLRKPIILYVGQFIQRKGLLQMIEALSGLKQVAWSLILVGNGPLQIEIEKQTKAEKLSDRVIFVGFQEKEELVKFYSIADIFVLPSLREPFAIVVSEALASGLFVVASKYDGGAWDLVQQGMNGLIVDPADVASLREGIRKAINIVKDCAYRRDAMVQSIASLDLERCARGLVNAIHYVS